MVQTLEMGFPGGAATAWIAQPVTPGEEDPQLFHTGGWAFSSQKTCPQSTVMLPVFKGTGMSSLPSFQLPGMFFYIKILITMQRSNCNTLTSKHPPNKHLKNPHKEADFRVLNPWKSSANKSGQNVTPTAAHQSRSLLKNSKQNKTKPSSFLHKLSCL